MRLALTTCLLAAVVGCGAGAAARSAEPGATDLKITVWPQGRGHGDSDAYTLRCAPAAGSLPRATAACSRLQKLAQPFAPIRKDVLCTEQYGGPQQAVVTGMLNGRAVWATFSASNGCHISRSKRIGFMLPGFGTAAGA